MVSIYPKLLFGLAELYWWLWQVTNLLSAFSHYLLIPRIVMLDCGKWSGSLTEEVTH